MFDIAKLDLMSDCEERYFWTCVTRILRHDDGEAAMLHLREGRPIYYCDDSVSNHVIREWPDGRKEVVQILEGGKIVSVGNASKTS
jgi:hypothetical protein